MDQNTDKGKKMPHSRHMSVRARNNSTNNNLVIIDI